MTQIGIATGYFQWHTKLTYITVGLLQWVSLQMPQLQFGSNLRWDPSLA